MIKLFNSNKIIVSVLFIPILLFFTGIDFYQDTATPSNSSYNLVSAFILDPFYSIPSLYQYLITTVVIFIQTILLIFITNKHQLQKNTNLLVGLFYLTYLAFMPHPFLLNESILANFFLIGSIDQVLESYKKHKAYGNIVNAGVYLGLASLFSPVLILLFIWCFIGILQLRSFRLKERLLLVIALLVPYYLLGTWLYFNGAFNTFFNPQLLEPFNLINLSILTIKERISLLFLILVSLVLFFNFRRYTIKRSMVVQRKIASVFLFFIIAIFLKLFLGHTTTDYAIALAIPMSIFSAILSQTINLKWAELITLLLIVNIICLRIDFILNLFGLN
jgi:hypothetical protein